MSNDSQLARRIAHSMNLLTRFMRRRWSKIRDPNFLDFPKYRKHGAYHWQSLTTDVVYQRLVEFVCEQATDCAHCLDIGCGDGAFCGKIGTSWTRRYGNRRRL